MANIVSSKFFGFLLMLGLLSCKGSIQDLTDSSMRRCGRSQHHAVPLYRADGSPYTALERVQLSLQTLNGLDASEYLTEKSCVDIPTRGQEFLISDLKTHQYAVIAAQDGLAKGIQLKTWVLPDFAWTCQAQGLQLRKDSQVPIKIEGDFALKGQSLQIEIQGLHNETAQIEVLSEKDLGLTSSIVLKPNLDDGDYLATPFIANPFGEKIPLAIPCPFSVFSEKPRLDLALNRSGELLINQGDSLPVFVDENVQVLYCLVDAERQVKCDAPGQYRNIRDWIVPDQGGRFQLFLMAQDNYGNESSRGEIPLAIDHNPPKIEIQWLQQQRNRIGHTEHLPYRYYEAKIQLEDDISSKENLLKTLECRVRLQINTLSEAAGNFAQCTQGLCEGKLLGDWTACSSEVAFQFDDSFWKQFPLATELILEARSRDDKGKLGLDSAMVMIDPALYPIFNAETWQGAALNNILSMQRIGAHDYIILRSETSDYRSPRQILTGDLGRWTKMNLPENLKPLMIESVDGRIIAQFSKDLNDRVTQLMEWFPGENNWKIVPGQEGLRYAAIGFVGKVDDTEGLWFAGLNASQAFINLSPSGLAKSFPCPTTDNKPFEQAKALIYSGGALFAFGSHAYYQLDPARETCTETRYSTYPAPIEGWNNRTIYKDQANRLWVSGRDQLDVLEQGQWQHIDLSSYQLNPAPGMPEGGYRFRDGSLAVLSQGDISFIPDLKSRNAFQLNKFNSKIVGGPPKNQNGEAYNFESPIVFFAEDDGILSVKGGLLTSSLVRNNDFFMSRQINSSNFMAIDSGQLYLGQTWLGMTQISERTLKRYNLANGLPFDTVSSVLFENGKFKTVYGRSNSLNNATIRKADYADSIFTEDLDFLKIGIRNKFSGLRSAMLDSANNLWFSLNGFGDTQYPSGNFRLEGKTLIPLVIPDQSPKEMSPSEKFVETADGKVFWRGQRATISGLEINFELYAWSVKDGITLESGSGQLFQDVYDLTEFKGELWVSGIDNSQNGVIAVYRNKVWQRQSNPGDGTIPCTRIGFNRKAEMFCTGRYQGIHLLSKGAWTSFSSPKWRPRHNRNPLDSADLLNGLRRFVFFEDGLLWVSQHAGEIEFYEIEKAPGWGRWWESLDAAR